MRLDDSVYEYIKEEVIDLLTRHDIKCIPISGFELANKMGIVLIPYSALSTQKLQAAQKVSLDGFYFESGDGRENIYYDDQVGYERCNMTILHEIGHAVLGHFEHTDPEVAESEAAFFAKYAVAPPPLVHKIRPKSPREIADVFCISYEASLHAFAYYQKWLYKHRKSMEYFAYEKQLLALFANQFMEVIAM